MMDTIERLIERAQKTQHGFRDIRAAADEVIRAYTPEDSIRLARKLFASKVHQARVLATFIFGRLAATSHESLNFLRTRVSRDMDWRVQEILAQAFCRQLPVSPA
jgi:HEAT repeat protein